VRQQPIPVVYEGIRIEAGFRADLVVEDKVIVEIKSVELLAPVHRKQLLTYLRLADKRLGLLINFHVALIKDGISRIVNGLEEDSHAKSPGRKDIPVL
jgi:GxxExxY protein